MKNPIRAVRSQVLAIGLVFCLETMVGAAEPAAEQALEPPTPSLWQAGIGEGFRKGANELGVLAGAGAGMAILGGEQRHHWALGCVEYGRMLTDLTARQHWFRGNLELGGGLFGGYQFSPGRAYVVGLTPELRWNFATGTHWVPFFFAGAGVTATDIRGVDLSTTFEFNVQIGAGVHWFLREDLALTAEYRFIHLSNAGIKDPNQGVNSSTFLLGASWFF